MPMYVETYIHTYAYVGWDVTLCIADCFFLHRRVAPRLYAPLNVYYVAFSWKRRAKFGTDVCCLFLTFMSSPHMRLCALLSCRMCTYKKHGSCLSDWFTLQADTREVYVCRIKQTYTHTCCTYRKAKPAFWLLVQWATYAASSLSWGRKKHRGSC